MYTEYTVRYHILRLNTAFCNYIPVNSKYAVESSKALDTRIHKYVCTVCVLIICKHKGNNRLSIFVRNNVFKNFKFFMQINMYNIKH